MVPHQLKCWHEMVKLKGSSCNGLFAMDALLKLDGYTSHWYITALATSAALNACTIEVLLQYCFST